MKTGEDSVEEIFIHKRPGMAEFLEHAAANYELIIYTSGLRQLLEPLLGLLDTKKLISYCLYREHCLEAGGKIVKDLTKLSRDLKNVVFIKVIKLCVPFINQFL